MSIVEYKGYCKDELDEIPILSLCFRNPFNSTKLETARTNSNDSPYLEFLEGNYFKYDMLQNDFKNIIFDISQYAVEYWFEWKDGTTKTISATNYSSYMFTSTYAGFWRRRFYNCYGMQVNCDKQLHSFSVLLKNDIFPSKIRPHAYDFITLLHYPNHLLLSTRNMMVTWPTRTTNITYNMAFIVTGMEVMKRRNKREQPCNEEWHNHDNIVLMRHSKSVACKAPYIYHNISIKPCSTKNEIKRARFTLRYDDYHYIPPCKAMEKLSYTYTEADLHNTHWAGKGMFWIGVALRNPNFKEIAQTR